MNPAFRVALPLDSSSLFDFRRQLRHWLEEIGATPDENHDVTVASSEACANAIEHSGAPPDSVVEFGARLDGDVVTVLIRDAGEWRQPRERDATGLGLRIMEATMDEVRFRQAQGGTEIRMVRRLQQSVRI